MIDKMKEIIKAQEKSFNLKTSKLPQLIAIKNKRERLLKMLDYSEYLENVYGNDFSIMNREEILNNKLLSRQAIENKINNEISEYREIV